MSSKPSTKKKMMKPASKPGKSQKSKAKTSKGRPSAGAVAASYAGVVNRGMRSGRPKGRRITGREFLYNINGSTATTASAGALLSLDLNPGLSSMFPLLSIQAKEWQFYRFHKLVYEYVSTASTAVGGTIIMAAEYNSDEAMRQTFGSYLGLSYEQYLMDRQDSAEAVAWQSFTMSLRPSEMFETSHRKSVRTTTVPTTLLPYDAGHLSVLNYGQAATTNIGKLFVSYDVELFAMQIPRPPTSSMTWLAQTTGTSQTLTSGAQTSVSQSAATGFQLNPWAFTGPDTNGYIALPADLTGHYLVDFRATVRSTKLDVLGATTLFSIYISQNAGVTPTDNYDVVTLSYGAAAFLDPGTFQYGNLGVKKILLLTGLDTLNFLVGAAPTYGGIGGDTFACTDVTVFISRA